MKNRPIQGGARTTRRTGTATVEMALVCPVLFVMVFGLFEVAYGYMVQHLIEDAARQGCRVGICYRKTNATVLSTVNSLLQTERVVGANTKILVNNVIGDVAAAKTGDDITVQITLPSSKASIFPRTGYLKGQLKATSTLRHQ